MFGLGVPELLFIMMLALLIFGPKRLPQIGRTLGKGMAEFRKASTELQRSINTELDFDSPPAPRRPTKAETQAAGNAAAGKPATGTPADSNPPSHGPSSVAALADSVPQLAGAPSGRPDSGAPADGSTDDTSGSSS